MSNFQGAPPQGQDKSHEAAEGMQDPPSYTQATDQTGYPSNPGYPPNPGYPAQPPPASGYPAQPPPASGYPVQPPPATGYPVQPPPPTGYPVQQPPPPSGYQAQPPGVTYAGQLPAADPNNVVIVNQPAILVHHNLMFRDAPVACACPNCHNQVTSNVRREIGGLTLLLMGALCIFGLWLFCCLIPLCIDACKDAVHTCPVCNHQLGRWAQL